MAPVTDTGRRPGRPRDAALDDRILAAARELIAEGGFEACTVDAVSRASGAPKSTIYRRWPTRLDLHLAAFRVLMQTRIVIPDTGNLRDDLRQVLHVHVDIDEGPAGADIVRFLLQAVTLDNEAGAAARQAVTERVALYHAVLERARARGELRPDIDIEVASDLVFGPVWARLISLVPVPDDYVDAVVDAALHGIAPGSSPDGPGRGPSRRR